LQSKVIKIAIVTYNLEFGGLSSATKSLCKMLSNSEFDVELLLLDQVNKPLGVKKYTCFKTKAQGVHKYFEKLRRYYNFNSYLKASKFDYIIDQRYRINIFSEFVIQKVFYSKASIIIGIHSARLETYLPNNKTVANFLFKNVYKIICCSSAIKEKIENRYGMTNAICIYNGVDVASAGTQFSNQFEFDYIIAAGRIEPLKQFDKLILAYSKTNLSEIGVKLVILGEGSQMEECKTLVKQLRLEENVVFMGYVSNPERYLASALFLVLCSKYEGFPMVILESMCQSTPVLSFDLESGPNEVIVSGENGILVENQNFESLKVAIENLASNSVLIQYLKKNTAHTVERFSYIEIQKQWKALLGKN